MLLATASLTRYTSRRKVSGKNGNSNWAQYMQLNKIIYAGHSAVFIEAAGLKMAIDPWLSGNPLCPESLKAPALDLIVLTHGHADHASDAPQLAKRTKAKVAATWELANIMQKEGVAAEQLLHMNKGGSILWNNLTISLTHALHSSSFDTAEGPVYAGEACGVVISGGKHCIYHAGDTALFSDMELIGDVYKPSIAFLPIGDCFTMGPAQAARAAKMIGCKIAIPIHYRTFGALTGTGAEFKRECSRFDIEVIELEPGAAFEF